MINKIVSISILLGCLSYASRAQQTMQMMTSSFSKNLSMNRDGSGTSWLPDAAPLRGQMFSAGNWQFMTHYNIFLRYNNQDLFKKGSRGGAKFDAPNMAMLMGQRLVGKQGLFHFGLMVSLDPLTVGGYGYPLLYQTGESWQGKSLIDRQHPHDLFSEVSVSYTQTLNKEMDAFIYFGYPGEPALGPVTFMHRPSGMDGPDAPIGHHWQDATHITFGVATLGFRFQNLKLEGSSFTGREPNENRYNFDKPLFDSYSARLSWNPGKNWALQASRGFIKSPEALIPKEDVTRTTASVNYATELMPGAYLSSNLVWGENQVKNQVSAQSIGFETALDWSKTSIYTRYEWVEKSPAELGFVLANGYYGALIRPNLYSINDLTLGINQSLFDIGSTKIYFGAQSTLTISPATLFELYGKHPISGEIFIRAAPGLMLMHSKKNMGNMKM